MTDDPRRTELVLRIFRELARSEQGAGIKPGQVNARLRELGIPMGTWEVRGEFSVLQARGEITLNEEDARWHLADPEAARKSA